MIDNPEGSAVTTTKTRRVLGSVRISSEIV